MQKKRNTKEGRRISLYNAVRALETLLEFFLSLSLSLCLSHTHTSVCTFFLLSLHHGLGSTLLNQHADPVNIHTAGALCLFWSVNLQCICEACSRDAHGLGLHEAVSVELKRLFCPKKRRFYITRYCDFHSLSRG